MTVRLVAAYIEQSLGEPERVARLNERAMARARELGSPRPLVSTLVAVGEHRWKLGDLVPARALCEECLRLASAIGLGTYQAVAHHNLSVSYTHLDVYKRQVPACLTTILMRCRPRCALTAAR